MDAYFASVEEMDYPEYRGKPLVVGGNPKSRGVVAAANYEARKYGIRSAMPSFKAYKLCPDSIFAKPRFERYKEISLGIRDIFAENSDIYEPLSIDEAWLDVTEKSKNENVSATEIAQRVRKQIYEKYRLTCSAGVSCNKLLAKIASKQNKPNGIYVIKPHRAKKFMADKPVEIIPYLGNKTKEKMHALGIKICDDLAKIGLEQLVKMFGKNGGHYYYSSVGIDKSVVMPTRIAKSVSTESTFSTNLQWGETLKEEIRKIAESLFRRYRKTKKFSKSLNVKVKFANFVQVTRSVQLTSPPKNAQIIGKAAEERIRRVMVIEFPRTEVRLIGIGLEKLSESLPAHNHPQLPGFETSLTG